jgi:integrase
MPYVEAPAFMAKLKDAPGAAAKALMFIILTAARSGEVYGATWDEIDLDAKRWTIPKERMKKAAAEHVIPLSDSAVAILRDQDAARGKNQFVFPSPRPRRPLSGVAMPLVMRRMGVDEYTVHGFRSAFRDWAADHGVDFEVAEACLSHTIGNQVTQAYLRSTMVARRRGVMADWAAFLTDETTTGTVIPLKGGRRS